jgi:hypothetical protein
MDLSRVIGADDRALSLGQAGRRLNVALLALETYAARQAGAGLAPIRQQELAALEQMAADLLWSFLVQREACGLYDTERVFHDYRVPEAVRRRVGASGR